MVILEVFWIFILKFGDVSALTTQFFFISVKTVIKVVLLQFISLKSISRNLLTTLSEEL